MSAPRDRCQGCDAPLPTRAVQCWECGLGWHGELMHDPALPPEFWCGRLWYIGGGPPLICINHAGHSVVNEHGVHANGHKYEARATPWLMERLAPHQDWGGWWERQKEGLAAQEQAEPARAQATLEAWGEA